MQHGNSYLDVTLNLNDGSCRPYKKPIDEANYIHVNFDHPTFILKQLPMSIEKRLSSLSLSKGIFEETVPYYEQYLSNFGYKENLNYRDPTSPTPSSQKENDKENLHGSTHFKVRLPKQKLVSYFCS